MTLSPPRLVLLGVDDIDRIMTLERLAFNAPIQADPHTVLHRLSLGHRLVGAEEEGGHLSGAVGFSHLRISLDELHRLPTKFKEYSTQTMASDADTICIYSLGIAPVARGTGLARRLIDEAFGEGRRLGFKAVIADGPLPSLNGNDQVRPRPAVREMIERYLVDGMFPSRDQFLRDPVLALYSRLTGCQFRRLVPDFLPEDEASGGWRVILSRDL